MHSVTRRPTPRGNRRVGRRPGTPDTRAQILAAARTAFGEQGFETTTIRQVAASAGVDPALVHHYFGTKDQLFVASLDLPVDPAQIVGQSMSGGLDGAGERLVRAFLTTWDSPAGVAGAALLRSAVSNAMAARLFREFIISQVVRRVFAHLDLPEEEKPLRMTLVASQISGLALVRYLLEIEPLASAPVETVVGAIGPTIQRYLTGEIDGTTD